jgi:hypothetical protein
VSNRQTVAGHRSGASDRLLLGTRPNARRRQRAVLRRPFPNSRCRRHLAVYRSQPDATPAAVGVGSSSISSSAASSRTTGAPPGERGERRGVVVGFRGENRSAIICRRRRYEESHPHGYSVTFDLRTRTNSNQLLDCQPAPALTSALVEIVGTSAGTTTTMA